MGPDNPSCLTLTIGSFVQLRAETGDNYRTSYRDYGNVWHVLDGLASDQDTLSSVFFGTVRDGSNLHGIFLEQQSREKARDKTNCYGSYYFCDYVPRQYDQKWVEV